jgi:hypothetical protein
MKERISSGRIFSRKLVYIILSLLCFSLFYKVIIILIPITLWKIFSLLIRFLEKKVMQYKMAKKRHYNNQIKLN